MTVIAYRAGTIAADSRETWENEAAGTQFMSCKKLYRKKIGRGEAIIGTAGGTYLGMVFVDWFTGVENCIGRAGALPEILRDAHLEEDFEVLIVERTGVYHANHLCRPIPKHGPFIAIGCGAKAAMALMHKGCTAKEACEITCKVDPFCAPPIITMRL